MSRNSTDKAERRAGIARVSDLRTVKLVECEIDRLIVSRGENSLLWYLQRGIVLDDQLGGLVD